MSPLRIVVLIVLIDLLGFSVVMPLLAPFAEQYGFRQWQIGLLFSHTRSVSSSPVRSWAG